MERAGRGFNQQHKHLPGNHEVMSSLVPQKKGGERAKFYLPSTQHITYTALPPLPWGRGQRKAAAAALQPCVADSAGDTGRAFPCFQRAPGSP